MLLTINDLSRHGRSVARKKGNQKIKDDPTILLKTKEECNDVLDDPTISMRIKDLIFEATMFMKRKELNSNGRLNIESRRACSQDRSHRVLPRLLRFLSPQPLQAFVGG